MVEGDTVVEVPFDMSKETLKSIRNWIDKITQLSVGMFGGVLIEPNEMIILKHKMVRQLIVLTTPLLKDDLEKIENIYLNIKLSKGNVRSKDGLNKDVIIYTTDADYELDSCIQDIQESLRKYFIPVINKGEKY
jgi:hypothetical protein